MVDHFLAAYENRTTQVLLEGAQELLGQENLERFMGLLPADLTFSLDGASPWSSGTVGTFLQALENVYGEPGGQGLALRIGRSAFVYGLKQFGRPTGLHEVSFRLLPVTRRLETGLNILAQVVAEQIGDSIRVVDRGTSWEWISEACPVCNGRESEAPCCFLTVGFLQEFMAWAGGGRFYRVIETECRAAGSPACVFRIDKQPLD